jgi:hypothetical protein
MLAERQRPGAAARSLMLSEIDTASPLKRRHLSDLPAHSESSPSRSSLSQNRICTTLAPMGQMLSWFKGEFMFILPLSDGFRND